MQHLKLLENLYWIGIQDHDLRVFDIVMETKYGTSYNSYLLKDKETVLFETVKVQFFDEYLAQIQSITSIENIRYLVVSHTEPDHAGSIEKLLALNKELIIVASPVAIRYLKNIVNVPFESKLVKQGEQLNIGQETLEFISVPNLHWPDTIYTYLTEKKTLITCDSFGSHYAFDDILLSRLNQEAEADYQDALLQYYLPIFSPFKSDVLKGIQKIEKYEINLLCPGHGPVLDTKINEVITQYKMWSTPEIDSNLLVVVPYTSAYGYTEIMAKTLKEVIVEQDATIEVELYDLNVLNYETLKPQLLSRLEKANAIFIGASTINKDAVPLVWDLLAHLSPLVHGKKLGGVFGSYGWSGEAVKYVHERLKQLKLNVLEPVSLCFKPTEEKLQPMKQLGVEIVKKLNER